jgi:hypothetical protein
MQGGYEKTAAILRRLLELRDEGLLDGVLEFTDTTLQPTTYNYIRDTDEILRARFGEQINGKTLRSTIMVTLPAFLGLEFKPFERREPETEAIETSRVAGLEARVARLEEQMQKLLPLLD